MYKIYLLLIFCSFSFFAKSQTVDFTYLNSNGSVVLCGSATINFTPVCTGNPIGFTWYFGNGQISNSAIPAIVFNTGTYNVKLVAVFQNVALEITKTIIVNPSVTADLSANSYICKLDTVKFTTNTNAINPTYLYSFGDGTPTLNSNSNSVKHYFGSYGTFNTNVIVTSANGCTATDDFLVVVKKFEIEANATPTSGCTPINVNFTCTAFVPTGSTVSSYGWKFGDAGTTVINTTTNTTSHTYLDSGSYSPTLLITTEEGCTNTFLFPIIKLGKPPTLTVVYPKKTVYCANENAQFVAKSDFANEYKWEYGDGDIAFTADTISIHKYNTLGVNTVKVTPIFNGCSGVSSTFTVNIIGVIAKFNYANTCSSKKTFQFTNLSIGNQIVSTWNFGDNSPSIITANPVHTFPEVGEFNTILTIVDNTTGCRDTTQERIYTANPILINSDTFLCRNASTTFTLLNNYNNPLVNIVWETLGLNPQTNFTGNFFTTNATIFGNFNTHLAIVYNGVHYCNDSIILNKLISVRGPSLSYFTSNALCTNNNFIITNTSAAFAVSDTIKSWFWTFGISGLVDIKYQPTPFIFGAEGTYDLQLIAKDKKGCADTLQKQILVKESPFLRIFPREKSICAGKIITLTAYHTDNLVWEPANLVSCNTCDTTFASPIISTKIYAIASSANGCSLKDSSIITVNTPFNAVKTVDSFFACKGDTVRIKGVLPTNKKIEWTPSFGLNNSTSFNPLITFSNDTTYTALLSDSAGCYSSAINVSAKLYPLAKVNAGPDRILAYGSPFTINPIYNDVTSYKWTPTGNLNCTICPFPSGLAEVSQTFVINTTNQYSCVSKDTISIFVECAYANLFMASAFNPTITGAIKYYYPQTRGIKKINRFSIYNRLGEVIFDIKNALPNVRSLGWDGKYRREIQSSAGYVYMLEATCELGEIITKKGSFLLVK